MSVQVKGMEFTQFRIQPATSGLMVRKVYRLLPDGQASKRRQVRVIDESGEDYLYPEVYFVPIKLPQSAERAMLKVM